jgi:hypothetical protein
MIAIITGDIINSRKLKNQDAWIAPLKKSLQTWGDTPGKWEIFRGDYFQLELTDPMQALRAALMIKALIKSIEPPDKAKRSSPVNVRMAIGIGRKDYNAKRISESNGPAFVFSGEKFEKLKNEKITLAVKTEWEDFDKDINLYLKLASVFMDKWSVSSGELIKTVLENPGKTQKEIGQLLGIEQNSVSGRWHRANADEIIEMEQVFREKLQKCLL